MQSITETMEKYTVIKGCSLEVVDSIPKGYIIISLDEGAFNDEMEREGYVLIAKPLDHQPNPNNWIEIDKKSYKALKCKS